MSTMTVRGSNSSTSFFIMPFVFLLTHEFISFTVLVLVKSALYA